jgi:enterobacterial common antigen flippase
VLTIGVGMIRAKAMAILLGPAGFGMMALYASVADLTVAVASLGVNSSAVRQIAIAVGTGGGRRIKVTVLVLRRTSILLGVAGCIVLAACAEPVSRLTFGDSAQAGGVALLALAVFVRTVTAGQSALLQGMRRIAQLAVSGIAGAVAGTACSIALIYILGEDGMVPSLIASALAGLVITWWFSRKIDVRTDVSASEFIGEAAGLLKLGTAFMASAVLTLAAAYAVRVMVLRVEGAQAAGLYQAAWTLGVLYSGMILQAMGTDFYPRLAAVACDNRECNRLVNEQMRVAILLAAPGITATVTLAPLLIPLFYSGEFAEATRVLRWICLGMAIRMISWPLGFIVMAKNARTFLLGSELAWTAVNVSLSWIFVHAFGLIGAGVAFLASYVFHVALMWPIAHRLSGYSFPRENLGSSIALLAVVSAVLLGFELLPPHLAMTSGACATVLLCAYSARRLAQLVDADVLQAVQGLRGLLRIRGLRSRRG